MLVIMANREDPDQTAPQKQSDLGTPCLSSPFGQPSSVQNFRTFPENVPIWCVTLISLVVCVYADIIHCCFLAELNVHQVGLWTVRLPIGIIRVIS